MPEPGMEQAKRKKDVGMDILFFRRLISQNEI